MNRPLRVFLCHSSNDKPAVRELYQKLRAEPWISPWLDEEELYPGQDWNMEIEKAIEETDVIIVCLSNNSITKEGYVQREIRIALDYADYKPEGTLFIIPVRLDECKPPKRLARWQYADYFEGQRERGMERLLVSLKRHARFMKNNFDVFSMLPPVTQTMTTYVFGDDLYDEAFSIDTADGAFMGEYGVEIPEVVEKTFPKRVPALTTWLFDKNDINTKKKILIPHQSFNNNVLVARLKSIGDVMFVDNGTQTLLETSTLQMLVTVVDIEIKAINLQKTAWIIDRLTLELAVWSKN